MNKAWAIAAVFVIAVSAVEIVGQEMPKPQLAFVGAEDVTIHGRQFRSYALEITNRSDFPDELFAAAPDLDPCGKNANSSRTWINIYIDGNRRIYGYCAIRSNTELSKFGFNLPADLVQPTHIYIDVVDRRGRKIARSNKVSVVQK